ncbi:MAG: Serine/threonine phosphatase stp [Chlamydiae bacterium]|nr:Serine/threonine phosphatase stp [Chlamydiota bacterium]
MKIKSFGASDIGLGRINNEDVFAQMPAEQFFILADGMGGHNAGEVAANETVFQLCNIVKEAHEKTHSPDEWEYILEKAIAETNTHVFQLSKTSKELEGMGTTLCLALITNSTFIYAHVGDSRIYRIRKNRLAQLTRDHSLKDDLIASGELDESRALSFPYKNVITRAIGTQETVLPDIAAEPIEPEDIYFLCSDGLTEPLSDAQIRDIITASRTPKAATESLILEAKKAGGSDNITVITLKIS